MQTKLSLILAMGLTFATSAAFGQQAKSVDDTVLRNAGKTGTEWLSYGLTPGETRYSPLNQINAGNISRLGLAWSYDIGPGGGSQEALRSSGTAQSTASPIGAWSTRSMHAPARS